MPDLRLLGRVLRFLRPAWRAVALSVLLGSATVGAGIGLIGTSAWLISTAALQPSIAVLQVAIVGVRFFGLTRGGFRYLERLVSHDANFHILAGMRSWFLERLIPLAPGGLLDRRGGDLLAAIGEDIDALELVYVRALGPALTAAIVTAGMTGFVNAQAPGLGWLLAGMLLAAGLGLPLLVRGVARPHARRMVTARAELGAALVEDLAGMPDLLLGDPEREHRKRIVDLDRTLFNLRRRLGAIQAGQAAATQFLGHLAAWGLLVALIPLVASGRINGVTLAVLVLAAAASFEAVAPLPAAAQALDASLEAARRLFALADREPPVHEPAVPLEERPTAPPALSVRGLGLQYQPDLPYALSGVDLELPPGKKVALVGPNGSGKTSLINCMLRAWEYQKGEIRLGGIDLRRWPLAELHRQFSVCSQREHLFDASLRENLTLGRSGFTDEDLARAIRTAQLEEFIQSLPNGLETPVGEHGLLLSGGERQRVALARVLLLPAPILVLDEPFSQLDTPTARSILAGILDTYAQQSLLLATHLFVGLEQMDEILIFEEGKIVERGKHRELLKANGLYACYYRYQRETTPLVTNKILR